MRDPQLLRKALLAQPLEQASDGAKPTSGPTAADRWAQTCSTRIAARDRGAMAELYESRYESLLHAIRRYIRRDEEIAADCVQDAWLRIFRRMPVFERAAAMDAWLLRVALTSALDRLKADRARARRESARATAESASSDARSEDDAVMEALWIEISRMDDLSRHAVEHRILRGWSLAQVAASFGIGLRAAESRLRRAVERLRSDLSEVDDA